VADLIELCFHDTIDADGQGYLRRLRQAARLGWLASWTEPIYDGTISPPISGFVWRENTRLVGNLSLFPFYSLGHKCYFVANVAVHPGFRGRGIASQLTSQALEYARQRGAYAAWLQVREDNPTAVHIYHKLGFQESSRRTTWVSTHPNPALSPDPKFTLARRQAADWPSQKTWLERTYPAAYAWHLPVNWHVLRPGLRGSLYRFLTLNFPRHWSVINGNSLLGTLTWNQTQESTDQLLLAAPEDIDEKAIQFLLSVPRRQLSSYRNLTLNLPAGFAENSLRATGFQAQQTLIWMEKRFTAQVE
jgi:ribosomal-protein-alanine N-acetyltransferase